MRLKMIIGGFALAAGLLGCTQVEHSPALKMERPGQDVELEGIVAEHAAKTMKNSRTYLKLRDLPGFAGNGDYEFNSQLMKDYQVLETLSLDALMRAETELRAEKVRALRDEYRKITKMRFGVEDRLKTKYYVELHYIQRSNPVTVRMNTETMYRIINSIKKCGEWGQMHKQATIRNEFKKKSENALTYGRVYEWPNLRSVQNNDPDVKYTVRFLDTLCNFLKADISVKKGHYSKAGDTLFFRTKGEEEWHELNPPEKKPFFSGYEKLTKLYKGEGDYKKK